MRMSPSPPCCCLSLQAFYLARTGRPGPVLVDVPKDIQQQLGLPDWDAPMAISGYMSRLPPPPEPAALAAVLKALKGAKKPVSGWLWGPSSSSSMFILVLNLI